MATDLERALELADAADAITMARFRADDLVVETKPDMTPVSEADRAVELELRDRLAGETLLGEEYGAVQAAAPADARRWIIDPIDGTKSYVRGLPVWATLIALQEDSALVLGVVSAPAMGRRWWASRGGGAFTSGPDGTRRIRVSAVSELAGAHLSFGGFEEWRQTGRLRALLELSERCWRTRGFGDFWQHMLVAEGAIEIAADPTVSLWDLAAPCAIVTEAGGLFTDFAGDSGPAGGSGLATNGRVHEAARTVLNR